MHKRQKNVFRRDRMATARKGRGLTQTQLAGLIQGKQAQIKDYETGQRIPQADTLAKLSKALQVSADYLLDLSDKPGGQIEGLSDTEKALLEVIRSGVSLAEIQAMMTLFKHGKD